MFLSPDPTTGTNGSSARDGAIGAATLDGRLPTSILVLERSWPSALSPMAHVLPPTRRAPVVAVVVVAAIAVVLTDFPIAECRLCAERRPDDVHGVMRCILSQENDLKGLPRHSLPLRINVSVQTLAVSSPDETSLSYEFHVMVIHKYIDKRLSFKPYLDGRYHPGLNIYPYVDSVWTPFLLPIESDMPLSDPVQLERMTIFPSGEVRYRRRLTLPMSCRSTLDLFPFDNPMCSLTFYAVGYRKDQVQLEWDMLAPAFRISHGVSNMNAYPREVEVSKCSIEEVATYNVACIKARTVFARERSFFWVTFFVPSFVLVTSAFMTFWFKHSPPRCMIGTTTRLTYISTTNRIRNQLPSVSNLVAMNVWDSVSMILIYFCLVEFIFVDYLIRHPRKHEAEDKEFVDEALKRDELTTCDRWTLFLRKPNVRIANHVDIVCRTALPIIYFKFIIAYFIAHSAILSKDFSRALREFKDLMD